LVEVERFRAATEPEAVNRSAKMNTGSHAGASTGRNAIRLKPEAMSYFRLAAHELEEPVELRVT
jgi:hypothetical protein